MSAPAAEKHVAHSSVAAAHKASVEFTKDSNGLDIATLKDHRGFSAQVHLHGGQVTAWKNQRGHDLLFMSTKAIFQPPKAIRGGIPVCFPQFSNLGLIERHGFARNRLWSIDPNPAPLPPTSENKATIDLILTNEDKEQISWNHSFELRLRISLGPEGELGMTARVRNTDTKPFTFTVALQNYFSVSDINEVRVEGLETLDYLDNLQNQERFTERGDALTFEAEVDKVYLSTPTKVAIIDHEKKTTFTLQKEGLPDAVVWNPWDKKAKAMVDFGDDEYKHMLCLQSAAIEKPITVKPGEEWKGRQKLTTVNSSYCSGRLDPVKVLASIDSL